MSASFCDCVNQWEQVLGLQVLKDTKHLSVRTRRDSSVMIFRLASQFHMYLPSALYGHCGSFVKIRCQLYRGVLGAASIINDFLFITPAQCQCCPCNQNTQTTTFKSVSLLLHSWKLPLGSLDPAPTTEGFLLSWIKRRHIASEQWVWSGYFVCMGMTWF